MGPQGSGVLTYLINTKGWDDRSPEISEIQWKYQNYPWSVVVDDPADFVLNCLEGFETTILTYLHDLIPKQEPVADPPLVPEPPQAQLAAPPQEPTPKQS